MLVFSGVGKVGVPGEKKPRQNQQQTQHMYDGKLSDQIRATLLFSFLLIFHTTQTERFVP